MARASELPAPAAGRVVSMHQPAYLPWLGYFDRIRRSDLFIFLDTVQFQKNSFQNRNKVRTRHGWVWLTVPVITKGRLYDTRLDELEIDNRSNWRHKHLRTIRESYARARRRDAMMPVLESVYAREWQRLADLCWHMLGAFVDALGIETPLVRASRLPPVEGAKSELVLNLCRQAGAERYLAGALGRGYLDEAAFRRAGIDVVYQDFKHPVYPQLGPGFLPAMGVIDLLMNAEDPAQVLAGGG